MLPTQWQSETLKADETISRTELRQSKYLNNVIEQDHRISSAYQTDNGIPVFQYRQTNLGGGEAMNMIRTRTSEWYRPREQCISSEVYRSNLWSECLR